MFVWKQWCVVKQVFGRETSRDEQEFDDRYVLVMRGYVVTIYKPYQI